MRDDPLMDRVVDLDEAAVVLAERTMGWTSAGLEVGRATWRDAEAVWPQPLETDRARVHDPDSVGMVISGPAGGRAVGRAVPWWLGRCGLHRCP
jgi:hypothetical protein